MDFDQFVHASGVLALERGATAVAVDVDFEDRGVMDEAIHRCQRHGGVREDLAPCPEWLIGGDQGGAAFVAGADQFKQDGGRRLILADIGGDR